MLLTFSKRQCLFPLFERFFRNLNDLESIIINHCKRMHFQESELMFCVTLKGKSGMNQI